MQIINFLKHHGDCQIDKISSNLIEDIQDSVTEEGWFRVLPSGKKG